MTTAAEILNELRACGATAYCRDDQVRLRPAGVVPPELLARVPGHRADVVALLRAEPATATRPRVETAPDRRDGGALPAEVWIVSSPSCGAMRLVVAAVLSAFRRLVVLRICLSGLRDQRRSARNPSTVIPK